MRRQRPSAWDSVTPWLVLVCGIIATIATAFFAYWTAREQAELRFHAAVEDAQLALQNRLEVYLALLRGGAAAMSQNENMTRTQFRTYVDRLRISRNYPGIQGIGFSRRILPEEKERIVAAARSDGFADFTLWPERAGECHAILYLEPMDARNRRALGYDMMSEENRRAAMERARDDGDVAASRKVTLVQEIDETKQAGFLIYTPVYRGGITPRSLEDRRSLLLGFVYAPFRVDDLFAGVFSGRTGPAVRFVAYDGKPSRTNLMHRSAPKPHERPARSRSAEIVIAGQRWTFVFHATDEPEYTALQTLAPATAVLGLLVTALLYTATLAQRRSLRRAEATQFQATQRAALRADIGAALALRQSSTRELLHACTEAIVRYLPAAFARIWTIVPSPLGAPPSHLSSSSSDPAMLQLQASSGIYTHLDGAHSRIAVGQFKIGLIAAERKPHLTNDVPNDPRIGDREWARRERMVSFAGYPLVVEDRVVGVVALFARVRLEPDTLEALAGVADMIAQGLQRREAEEALHRAQEELRQHATQLEARVAERTRSLEETVKSLEGFSYSVAHDLRAPLRTIHSFGSLLVEEHATQIPPVGQDYVRRMITAAARMDDLIQDLLAYNRLGREDLPCHPISLDETIAAVLDHLRDEITRRDAEVSVSPGLPSIVANPTLLAQVLTNLLINALKFVEPGRRPRVTIAARLHNNMVRVEITDNGIGIEPTQQKRIFGVFERLHGGKQFPGTGIGLAIVQKAVETMGGTVGVISHPAQGSTFWFELRAADPGTA
jgi:signal transduction histidine kinase/CHASE1-domain containing sensor protein